jgi:hypothetical protein
VFVLKVQQEFLAQEKLEKAEEVREFGLVEGEEALAVLRMLKMCFVL